MRSIISLPMVSILVYQLFFFQSIESTLIKNDDIGAKINLTHIPQLSTFNPSQLRTDNSSQDLLLKFRQKKRQERLAIVKSEFLLRLGRLNASGPTVVTMSPPSVTPVNPFAQLTEAQRAALDKLVQRLQPNHVLGVNEIATSNIFSEKRSSFFPSCSKPKETDELAWQKASNQSMNIFYDIHFPQPISVETEITILSSKLRLNIQPFPGSGLSNMIITVYQYLRPLKVGGKVRKIRVTRKTITDNTQGWVELDIGSAVSYWQRYPLRNYGLRIDIEQKNEKSNQNIIEIITPMDCHAKPSLAIPETVLALLTEATNGQTTFSVQKYPTLDLLTIEAAKTKST